MNILIVNDDGYKSQGLKILVQALIAHGNLYVAAPYEQQSARSQAISIGSRIEAFDVDRIFGTQRTIAVNGTPRSEEHTSELQSRPHLVCRLLLEKKKNHPP